MEEQSNVAAEDVDQPNFAAEKQLDVSRKVHYAEKEPRYQSQDIAKHESKTASSLAFVVVSILGGALLFHYTLLTVFSSIALYTIHPETVEQLLKH
ncbi:MAG: hypothetical protein FWC43_09850 [Planctomycetaceae bacterium]|nr:hypothetical protein [Planctomycetaceae bacterium]